MSWKKDLKNSFGLEDQIFAGHPTEIDFARKMLKKVLGEDISLGEVIEEAQLVLQTTSNQEHIEVQKERIKDLSNYFQTDE